MPCNSRHTLLLNEDGLLFGCGSNTQGELADDQDETIHQPFLTHIKLNVRLMCIAAGYESHSLAVGEDGSLWAWGNNHSGQLGLANHFSETLSHPMKLSLRNRFVSVAAGHDFSLALDQRGRLWSFGCNSKGQLGLGDWNDRMIPTVNDFLPKIRMIEAGYAHVLVLDESGTLWSFGANSYGQLGVQDYINRNSPTKVQNLIDVQQISVGFYHNLVLGNDSRVWCFGQNNLGQLGLGHTQNQNSPHINESLHSIQNVWCGGNSSYVKDQKGVVSVFGYNYQGQLGLGDRTNRLIPCENSDLTGQDVVACGYQMFGVHPNGHVYSCGRNDVGQLGQGHTMDLTKLKIIENFLYRKRISPVKSAKTVTIVK